MIRIEVKPSGMTKRGRVIRIDDPGPTLAIGVSIFQESDCIRVGPSTLDKLSNHEEIPL